MGIQNICTICSRQINDMYFLIVGSKMTIHLECLKCTICLQKLEMQSKCYVKNGKFYCYEHYESEQCCSSCHIRLLPSDYVIRSNSDRMYHLSCFKCVKCTRQIEPGSKYGMVNDMIMCSRHYLNPDDGWDMDGRYDQSSSSLDSSPLSFNPQLKSLENRTSTTKNGSTRKKRLRTSFKHQQLRIMKAHFQINQNPDSKDLKELSERTGLQKRVLQVWFQNSRAKQRKSTNGSFVGLNGILSSKPNSVEQAKNEDSNYQDDDDDENLEYEIDDDLNESNSKSMDENYTTTSEQTTQFYNQQQPVIDFYNCF